MGPLGCVLIIMQLPTPSSFLPSITSVLFRCCRAVELDSYCRDCRAVELDSLTVLTATDDGTTVETVDVTVEAVDAVDLTALSRLSSCRALSMPVDTCCRAVEPGLRAVAVNVLLRIRAHRMQPIAQGSLSCMPAISPVRRTVTCTCGFRSEIIVIAGQANQ